MDDDRLAARIRDAVTEVEPRDGLGAIRSRTRVRRRRSWAWGAGGAVLATAATIAAVSTLGGSGTTGGGPAPAPASRPAATATSATDSVTAYFVGNTTHGARLFPETYPVKGDLLVDQTVERSLRGDADDPDYFSLWPDGATLQRAQLENGALSVDVGGDLADRPGGMTPAQARLALQQLVRSAQSATRSSLPVTFLLDGRPTPTLLGLPTAQPVPASSDEDLAQVQITSPSEGAEVSSPFTVTGRAASFEANVQWHLRRGTTEVANGYTTAEECCTLAPYSFVVKAPPGTYTLVVHDEAVAGGEGLPPWRDSKQVVVR
jgi:hypothetical protein